MRPSIPFLDLSAMHAEIADELDDAWQKVTRGNSFIGGELVEQFESEWAMFCETDQCVGVSDGTAALKLAMQALQIGAGDEVIVPANTFIATWEAVVSVGARPVPIDVDPHTLLITAAAVESAVTQRTAAVIAVHLFGQPVDMAALNRAAERAGIAVIEDAAQAHGATWHGRRAGGLSAVGCFSFYPGKNLGAFGDAGAIVTNDRGLAERIRSLANHGRERDAAYRHIYVGSNHRLDGLQAAVLSVKLKHLDKWNAARRRAARRYAEMLNGLALEQVQIGPGAVSSHHLAVVQVPNRDNVKRRLADEAISTGIHYPIPCHKQAAFAEFAHMSLPVAERSARQVLSLPMHPTLSEADMSRVAEVMRKVLPRDRRALQRRPNLRDSSPDIPANISRQSWSGAA